MANTVNEKHWSELLVKAVTEPGKMLAAYNAFHNYSIGNCISAMYQLAERGLSIGQLATFKKWREMGRWVKKGQKAITLCMPVTCKTGRTDDEGKDEVFTRFVYKNLWFALSQTDGEDVEFETAPNWSQEKALENLDIETEEFVSLSANTQGYATFEGKVAINPLAKLPHKVMIHEIAHQILGHCNEGTMVDGETLTKNEIEVEAESVAMIVCDALGLSGAEYCRGYIQHWINTDQIEEKSARRIFGAADRILKAGSC
jgi:antirestriction protein ArdC